MTKLSKKVKNNSVFADKMLSDREGKKWIGQEVWHRIFTEFFPTSEYKPSGSFNLEIYSDGDMYDSNYHSEIRIAVEKK